MAGAIAGFQIGLARTLRKIKNAEATSGETAKTAQNSVSEVRILSA